MKKAHITIISFPHPPHVNPTLPIVSVLVRRGHRVTYGTSDRFASRVAELGAEIVPCPAFRIDTLSDGADEKESWQPYFRLAIGTLTEMARFYEGNRPDLMIYDSMAFAGRIFANRWGIQSIQINPSFAHDKENWSQQVKDPDFRKWLLESRKHADHFLEQHGIVASDSLFHREKLNIHLFPKALQPKGDVFGEEFFYAGRCAGEQPYYGDWQRRDTEGRPIVLVSTSTSYLQGPRFFRMCIDALSDLQWHVILSIGDSCDAASLAPLPAHFEIVQHTSHIKMLPHVSLFICLGGIITTAEAAYHGIPLVVTTHGFPELEWQADNIEDLGIGIHVRKAETNADTLRSLAVRVLGDRELLNRVRRMQRTVQREPGAEETVNRIEEYLETFCWEPSRFCLGILDPDPAGARQIESEFARPSYRIARTIWSAYIETGIPASGRRDARPGARGDRLRRGGPWPRMLTGLRPYARPVDGHGMTALAHAAQQRLQRVTEEVLPGGVPLMSL